MCEKSVNTDYWSLAEDGRYRTYLQSDLNWTWHNGPTVLELNPISALIKKKNLGFEFTSLCHSFFEATQVLEKVVMM
jgi:hypothetical protein